MRTQHINPRGLSVPNGYSQVTVSGPSRLAHIAGQVARDVDGCTVGPGDLGRQTEQVYANLRAALGAVGAELKDLVRVVTYVVDLTPDKAAVIRAVRSRHMGSGPYPASTMVGVSSLVTQDFLVEIEATAAMA